jgi:tetratricopeptide (TPR) repeat protein
VSPAPGDDSAAAAEFARAAALERAGDWTPAHDPYAHLGLECARAGDLRGAVEAVRGEARVCLHQGCLEEAEELATLSHTLAERAGVRQAAARALNMVAAIRHSRGDLDGARRGYLAALDAALDLGDDELVGLLFQNLGILANVEGDLREARVRYLESIGSFVRCGNRRNAALVYNNLGMVSADLREWMEAEVCFGRGIEIAERIGDLPLLAKLNANRSEPLLRLRSFTEAAAALDRAEEIAGSIGAAVTLSDVARFRGVLARAVGNPGEAERHLARALEIAEESALGLERAEALRELAELRFAQGAVAAADALARDAEAAFHAIGARRDAERVAELRREGSPVAVVAGG